MINAKKIMSSNVLTAEANTSFGKIVRVFVEMDIHHIPIVNNEGNLVAMLSSTDALRAMHETDEIAQKYEGYSLEQRINVKSEMTTEVITILPETTISEAINIMVKNKIHALPVVENNKLLGTLSSDDVLKAIHNGEIQVKTNEDEVIFY